MGNILIMSDIHGNLTALNRVLEEEKLDKLEGIILLGDLIDYGPHSNEVIQKISAIPKEKRLVNLWGNHEKAIHEKEYSKFSTERGKRSASYTREKLTGESIQFMKDNMETTGMFEFNLTGKTCLAVHGSKENPYWKSISHLEQGEEYNAYDIVFSGHSHIPHYFEHFYDCDDVRYRGKKKTIFINPGSVGQPRNHNPNAQYAILDTESMAVTLKTIAYDIERELQEFPEEIDLFYQERLRIGV